MKGTWLVKLLNRLADALKMDRDKLLTLAFDIATEMVLEEKKGESSC